MQTTSRCWNLQNIIITIINNNGPNNDPGGAPLEKLKGVEVHPPHTTTLCVQTVKKEGGNSSPVVWASAPLPQPYPAVKPGTAEKQPLVDAVIPVYICHQTDSVLYTYLAACPYFSHAKERIYLQASKGFLAFICKMYNAGSYTCITITINCTVTVVHV